MFHFDIPNMADKTYNLNDFSPELLCEIFRYLPVKQVLAFSMLSRKMLLAVDLHLRLCKSIDFCEGQVYAYMPSSITDDCMHSLLKKCPHLETVYGLHPLHVERRRLRKRSALTVPGIIDALSLCSYLKAVETSDLKLLEAILQNLPQLEIIGRVRNRDAVFPPHASQRLKLQPYPKITCLNLIGVEIPELTAMPHLQHLSLQCVRFTKLQPFRAFIAQNLQSFVMKHCIGPSLSLRYLSLIIALSSSPSLRRLELVRVPLPGGLFQRAVEDSYRHNGFVRLTTLVIAGCKGVLEADIGHLMIVASQNLKNLYIQPSLTKDSLFVSLSFAQCTFPKLRTLYLGYVDVLKSSEEWSNEALLNLGLAEVPDTPSSLTDSGMKVIGQLFPRLETLSVSNCPHLILMDQWSEGGVGWQCLLDLTLQRCHCLRLSSFYTFLTTLPRIEVIILVDMFREPPKGCSHVGLSAGTGLGMSSAVVSNQDEHIAVQGHQQDFEPQADENLLENDDIDRDFIENENEILPEPHFMVLQQDLFDEQNPLNNPEERVNFMPDDLIIDGNVLNIGAEEEIHDSEPINNDIEIKMEENVSSPSSPLDFKLNHEIDQNVEFYSSCSDSDSDKTNQNLNKMCKRSVQVDKTNNCLTTTVEASHCHADDVVLSEVDSNKLVCNDKQKDCDSYTNCNVTVPHFSKDSICSCCDPQQPSTSRATCCHSLSLDSYSCSEKILNDSYNALSHASSTPKLAKCSNETEKQEVNTLSQNNNLQKDYIEVDSFVGPITRNRRKILDNKSDMTHVSLKKRKQITKQGKKKKKKTFRPVKHKKSSQCQPCAVLLPRIEICDKELNSQMHLNENSSQHGEESVAFRKVKNFRNSSDSENSNEDNTNNQLVDNKKSAYGKDCFHSSREQAMQCRNSHLSEGGQSSDDCIAKNSNKQKEIMFVSQGTQATSADIRRCLRRMKSQKKTNAENSSSSDTKKSQSSQKQSAISRRIKHKSKQTICARNKENKATSTSDPLLEDDAVQVLSLASETLRSLTVVSCGLSDIIINRSDSLTHVEVQACRILRSCQIFFCPSLKRFNISQCPKLSFENLVSGVLDLETYSHLMVTFEPWIEGYHQADAESSLFFNASLDQNLILCHDFTNFPSEINQTIIKTQLFSWMDTIDQALGILNFERTEPKLKIKPEESSTYPWDHDLRRIHGVCNQIIPDRFDKELNFDILTNNLFFASALELFSWEKGFPNPDCSTIFSNTNLLLENIIKVLKMQNRIKTFYIPVFQQKSIH